MSGKAVSHSALMRIGGLMRKEFLQILRDPSSIAIAFVMPVVLLLIFGYGVSLDARDIPMAIVVDQPTAETQSFIASFQQSRYFAPTIVSSMRTAKQGLQSGRFNAIVRLREDFDSRVHTRRPAPIQVIINAVDANTARLARGYIEGTWTRWLEIHAREQGSDFESPVQVEQRIWYNSEVRSRNYLVPGLIAVIMTLIGALLTALIMAREWERGTMEALLVTPVAMREILLGKLLPYFILGMGGMALSMAMALWLFEVPLRGSIWVLFMAAGLFLLAALGMGLLISIVTRNQFVAGQVAIIVTFLPAFILSGFIFDIGSMPWPIEMLTYLIAARYFVAILQTVFLAGDIWSVILPNAAALIVIAVIFLTLARLRAHKRLD